MSTVTQEFLDHLSAIIGTTGAAVLATTVKFAWKPLIKPLINKVMVRINRQLTVEDCHAKDAILIQYLSELRAFSEADRIAICQFQNGEHFSSNMVGWKSTVTHEVTALGVEPTLSAYQQILASRLYDILKLLFDESTQSQSDQSRRLNRSFTVCRMTEDLPSGFARYSCESRGVKKFILAPIFAERQGEEYMCGFIRLEYCGANAHRCADLSKCQDCAIRRNILEKARMVEMEMYARARRK